VGERSNVGTSIYREAIIDPSSVTIEGATRDAPHAASGRFLAMIAESRVRGFGELAPLAG
jgi:hypothetical protein